MKHKPDANTKRLLTWMTAKKANQTRLHKFLENNGDLTRGVTHFLYGHELGANRKKAITHFKIK